MSSAPDRPAPGPDDLRPQAAGPDASSRGAEAAEAMSFEDSSHRLAQIVEELEGGDLPLERSLELFEEGVKLARMAQERLDRAERRVEELLGFDTHGKPIVREFES
jgi:exodeoxyribonuclease VII small subunit